MQHILLLEFNLKLATSVATQVDHALCKCGFLSLSGHLKSLCVLSQYAAAHILPDIVIVKVNLRLKIKLGELQLQKTQNLSIESS